MAAAFEERKPPLQALSPSPVAPSALRFSSLGRGAVAHVLPAPGGTLGRTPPGSIRTFLTMLRYPFFVMSLALILGLFSTRESRGVIVMGGTGQNTYNPATRNDLYV